MDRIQYYKEKGREVLAADKIKYWDEIVPVRVSDMYGGRELEHALDVIKLLNEGKSLDEAEYELDSQKHSGNSFGLVCAIIREFSDRGNDFVKHVW